MTTKLSGIVYSLRKEIKIDDEINENFNGDQGQRVFTLSTSNEGVKVFNFPDGMAMFVGYPSRVELSLDGVSLAGQKYMKAIGEGHKLIARLISGDPKSRPIRFIEATWEPTLKTNARR